MQGQAVKLGDLIVDPGARTVERDGRPIELPKLSFDLLLALINAAPEALSTDALMDQVWAGRVVSPATIAKRVEMLRQALGDDAAKPRYVALVRGFGYRLATTVETTARPPATPTVAQAERRRAPRALLGLALVAAVILPAVALFVRGPDEVAAPILDRSIAVLPFEALGDAPEDRWFADGLAEEIGHSLSRTGRLRVAGRLSTRVERLDDAPPDVIGKTLGVAHLLTGSVRRDGDRLRIVAKLTETRNGFQLWTDTFDVSAEDALEVQRLVAERVAERFETPDGYPEVRDPAASSSSPVAYSLYLQAVSLSPYPYSADHAEAQALIERVVELDPGFALGWNRLAAIHGRRLFFDPTYPLRPPEAIPKIRAAIDRALAIDPTLGAAYRNLAGLAWAFDRDMERAARLLEQALALDPWDLGVLQMAADFLQSIGDLEGARDLGAHILRRDPLCVRCRAAYASSLLCLGDFEGTQEQIDLIEDLAPGRTAPSPLGIVRALPEDPEAAAERIAGIENPYLRLPVQAKLAQAQGDTDAARQFLGELMSAPPNYWAMQAHTAAMLGEKDLALRALRNGMQRRFLYVQGTVCWPAFDPFRDDPEWQAMMLELGFNADGSQAVRFDLPPLPGYD